MTKQKLVTHIYSYEIAMLIHVIADSEKEAKMQLDEKGGIMTKREVKFVNSAPLYGEKENS